MTRSCLLMTDMQRSAVMGLCAAGPATRSYTPYGYASSSAGPLTAFAGERHDQQTDCYHLGRRARLYSPGLMRFLSPDPLSPLGRGGINVYAYCTGDPVNNTDPTGRFGEAVLAGLTANARSITTAAYIGVAAALLTDENASLGALRQVLTEGTAVIVGLHMQYSQSPIVQGVGLGLMAGGVATAVIKGGRTIYVGFRDNGFVGTVKTIGANLKRVVKETNHGKVATVAPSSPSASVNTEHSTGGGTRLPTNSGQDYSGVSIIDVADVRQGDSNFGTGESTHL